MTARYFAVQFTGPLAVRSGTAYVAVVAVLAVSLPMLLGVAAILAHRAIRERALAWHLPIRAGVALLLVVLAGRMPRRALS